MIERLYSSVAQATVRESALNARQIVDKMPGGSRSLLVVDSDKKLWVTKFRRNPQHHRLVINEYLGTRIAAELGFTVPQCTLIYVGAEVFRDAQRATTLSRLEAAAYEPGIAFGSAYAGVGRWRKMLNYLPANGWQRVDNRSELAGMLVFDTWVQNTDRRQAVYVQEGHFRSLKALWIDQGNCFGDAQWDLDLYRPSSLCSDNPVYASLASWEDLEPWLARVQAFPSERIREIVSELPPEWLTDQVSDLQQLIAELEFRKGRLRTAILDVIYSRKRSFPAWPTDLRTATVFANILASSPQAWTEPVPFHERACQL